MHRPRTALVSLAAAALAASALTAAPVAYADGLGGISGWQPTPDVCGGQNQIPILISNASEVPQTGSITVNDNLAANVGVYATQAAMVAAAPPCEGTENAGQGYSLNFTVQPGETAVYWAWLGGVDSNDYLGSQDIAIGGLPSGTPGASWYDFQLNLTALLGFGSMQVQYSGTGGTDMRTSGQNNFNVIPCWQQDGNVNPGVGTLTPYSAGNATGPTYGSGDPVCLAWLPEGYMTSFTNAGVPGMQITAAQYNPWTYANAATFDFAGTFTGEVTIDSLSYNIVSASEPGLSFASGSLPLAQDGTAINTAATFAFWDGDTWGAVNIPTPAGQSGSVQVWLNGSTLIGSAPFEND